MSKQHVHHFKRDEAGIFADEDADVKTVRSLAKRGYTAEAIAKATGVSLPRVKHILGGGK